MSLSCFLRPYRSVLPEMTSLIRSSKDKMCSRVSNMRCFWVGKCSSNIFWKALGTRGISFTGGVSASSGMWAFAYGMGQTIWVSPSSRDKAKESVYWSWMMVKEYKSIFRVRHHLLLPNLSRTLSKPVVISWKFLDCFSCYIESFWVLIVLGLQDFQIYKVH